MTTEKERRELRDGTAIVANGENIVRGGEKPIASRYFDDTGSGEKISPLFFAKDFNGSTGRI